MSLASVILEVTFDLILLACIRLRLMVDHLRDGMGLRPESRPLPSFPSLWYRGGPRRGVQRSKAGEPEA